MENGGDILQLCRLCLVKDDVNISIFEEQGDIRQILQKISSCLPVKVSREDKLPKKICDGCSYKLDMFYEFWNSTANAEKQLLSWLGEIEMKSKLTDGAVASAVAAQQMKPAETVVKQEAIDPSDIHTEENDDDKSYTLFPQGFSAEEAGSSATAVSNEEPPPKRARRTAAVKAQIAMDPESDDDDDSGEPVTKVEDESEESEGDDRDPPFVDAPSTSADDQPGPSGVGKDGAEAPRIKNEHKRKARKPKEVCKPLRKEPRKMDPVELAEALICKFCYEPFKNNVDYAMHSNVHSYDDEYSCHLCSYSVKSRDNFEKHVTAHENSNTYKCEVCNKTFKVSTHAVEHKNIHTGEKPFGCEVCGKHFTYSRLLSAHRRTTHYELLTGKPLVKYVCKICSKHYETYPILQIHMYKKHNDTGEDKSIIRDNRSHRKTHTGEKPYVCSTCDKEFRSKRAMEKHTKNCCKT